MHRVKLKRFVALKEVTATFREHKVRIPEFGAPPEMLAPALTRNYQLVGTAFDFLLRLVVQRLNASVPGPVLAS